MCVCLWGWGVLGGRNFTGIFNIRGEASFETHFKINKQHNSNTERYQYLAFGTIYGKVTFQVRFIWYSNCYFIKLQFGSEYPLILIYLLFTSCLPAILLSFGSRNKIIIMR